MINKKCDKCGYSIISKEHIPCTIEGETSELTDLIWIEKYRPSVFEDLIFEDKSSLIKYLDKPTSMPSFIFHSVKPGTGKTSTAKIIIKYLDCDYLIINSSDERGIDTIRDKIKLFSTALSSKDNIKRCIFLDESDGLTRQAQDSLRNLMEEYSDNCFFIFSCNDINKIIEPLRSRCQIINFDKPNKADIYNRLTEICEKEKLASDSLEKLIDTYYPDIRTMINKLQNSAIDGKSIIFEEKEFDEFLDLMKKKNVSAIYEKVYSGSFDVMSFNKWYFHKLFKEYNPNSAEKTKRIAFRLADTEKYWNLGANLEIVFIGNILEILKEF